MNRVNVLGVGIDNLTLSEAVDKALSLISEHRCAYMVTPNPEIVMAAWDDPKGSKAIENADLVIPDGVGVMQAARILGTPLREHMPGIDAATEIIKRLASRGGSVFLYGARPGVAEEAAERMKQRFPGLVICGTNDGYGNDDGAVVSKINAAKPDFVMVCLGVPKQELWMAKHAAKLFANRSMSSSVVSHEVTKRASFFDSSHM